MGNFDDNIKLEIINKGNEELNIRIQENINNYLLKLYRRILGLCHNTNKYMDAYIIQKKYMPDILMIGMDNYWSNIDEIEYKILEELPIEDNYKFSSIVEENIVIKFIIQQYKLDLKLKLNKFCKEELIMFFYGISSMLSYISVSATYMYKSNYKDQDDVAIDVTNMIIDTINLFKAEERVDIYGILGLEKKSCEYVINYILNDDIDYLRVTDKNVNIDEIFLISNRIVEILSIKNALSGLRHIGVNTQIKGKKLRLDKQFEEKYMSYLSSIYDYEYDINSDEAKKIFEIFEKKEGYSPNILEEYVSSSKKNFITNVAINLVEDSFLYLDIAMCTHAKEINIKKLIESLSLKKTKKDLDLEIFTENNRLFRTPIIPVKNYFIISFHLLIEATHYLKYRILRRNLSKDKQVNNKIKELYDEGELKILKNLIDDFKIVGGINVDLQKDRNIKKIIPDRSEITKEIDFYFIFREVLYTVEYKNQKIDQAIYDVSKSYSRNENNINKNMRMIRIIKENKKIFQESLGGEFKEIKSFIVFKNINSFIDFYKEGDIICCTYKDFYDWLNMLLVNESYIE